MWMENWNLNIKILSAIDTHISPSIAVGNNICLSANERKNDFLENNSMINRTISVQYFTTVTKASQFRWPFGLRRRSTAS
jgi:hypothetical protein